MDNLIQKLKNRKKLFKKGKGFTLIELLAVIAILVVILLIAIPIILNVVRVSKKAAIESSAKIVAREVENTLALNAANEGVRITSIDCLADARYGLKGDYKYCMASITYDGDKPTVKVTLLGDKSLECWLVTNGTSTEALGVETTECDAYVDNSDYNEDEGVNRPRMLTGLTPIKWVGGVETVTTEDDPDWYDYNNLLYANAKSEDGSYWVWIPRYVYRITSKWSMNPSIANIDLKFSIGTDDTVGGEVTIVNTGSANDSNGTWTNHPAFTFGDKELTGFWISKFAASAVNPGGSCVNAAANTSCDTVAIETKYIPDVNPLIYTSINQAFVIGRAAETNPAYGFNSSEVDSHLIKNTELGALFFLNSVSTLVTNRNVGTCWWPMTTGNGASLVVEPGLPPQSVCIPFGTTNQYGEHSSENRNITGVYDLAGGYVGIYTAAYLNNGSAKLMENGSALVTAEAKYKDVYEVGSPDSYVNNTALAINKKGDAIYEFYYGYSSLLPFPNNDFPFFVRGQSSYDEYDYGSPWSSKTYDVVHAHNGRNYLVWNGASNMNRNARIKVVLVDER